MQGRYLKQGFCLVVSLLLGSYTATAFSAEKEEDSTNSASARPRIGLVLAGGGAKGGAHVGVLKVLEEQGLVRASGKTIVVLNARPAPPRARQPQQMRRHA